MERRNVLTCVVIVLALTLVPFSAQAAWIKLCIDPGHGGSDPGAVGYGITEAATNLDISVRARNLFQQDGATVVMTRTSDTYVSLQGRCDIANNNGCNRFLCSHCNAFNGAAYGTETFSYPGSTTGADYRNKVNAEMVSHMGTYNRGNKTANFYVLVNTNMPAILCEVGFIDHSGDNAKLANANYRQEAARAYLHGTQSHYGIAPHDPVSDIIVDNTSASFSAGSSWAAGTASADKYGSNYRYRSTAAVSDPAKWAPTLTNRNYSVYAWWPQGTNRSASAPYIINHNGGSTTVKVNQQVNGGKWNLLGTWAFSPGKNVQLSCWTTTGYVVMGDAIKFVPN
ncbi:MAG: hypothetical protein GX139_07105 [Armatimonadetes bacterium]|nr:hypothetical protein [Armatimonadota bacterium]